MNFRLIFSLTLFALVSLAPVAVAADPNAASSSDNTSSSTDNSGTVVNVPKQPTVSQFTPPKPADRQKSSAMAKAMALGGQAQSMIMCMQMQQEALKAKSSGDKMMMLMMANQACQQSAEMGKAAAEADKGQKAVSQDDIPKQSVVTIEGQQLPSGSAKEDTSALASYKAITTDEPTKSEDPTVAKPVLPDLGTTDPKVTKKADVAQTDPKPVTEAPNLPKSVPSLIKSGSVSMNDSDKKDGLGPTNQGLGPNAGGAVPGLAGNGKSPADEAKNVKTGGALTEAEGREKAKATTEAGEGSGGGGGSSSGEKGADPFEAMLAQLMGGPPPAEGGPLAGEEIELIPNRENTKPPNIFEYATFRLQKLGDQKRLRGFAPVENKNKVGLEKKAQYSPKVSRR